jgi:hypothetical protein
MLIKRIVLTPMTSNIEVEFNFMEDFEELNHILNEGGAVNE